MRRRRAQGVTARVHGGVEGIVVEGRIDPHTDQGCLAVRGHEERRIQAGNHAGYAGYRPQRGGGAGNDCLRRRFSERAAVEQPDHVGLVLPHGLEPVEHLAGLGAVFALGVGFELADNSRADRYRQRKKQYPPGDYLPPPDCYQP